MSSVGLGAAPRGALRGGGLLLGLLLAAAGGLAAGCGEPAPSGPDGGVRDAGPDGEAGVDGGDGAAPDGGRRDGRVGPGPGPGEDGGPGPSDGGREGGGPWRPPRDERAPWWPSGARLRVEAVGPSWAELSWDAAEDDVGVAGYEVLLAGEVVAGGPRRRARLEGLEPDQEHTVAVRAVDGAGRRSGRLRGTVRTVLPPRPAPPKQRAAEGGFLARHRHLLEGPSARQRAVVAGSLPEGRVVRLFGWVEGPGGAPLPGVRVEVLGHPEWGYTLSREDGRWDLLAVGGAGRVVRFRKDGYLESQRAVEPSGWEQWVAVERVRLVARAPVAAVLRAGASSLQVARGERVDDGDGARQPTLLLRGGTSVEAVLGDGSRRALSTLTFRLTEYTVGDAGPLRMPGTMPRQIAYTYALEVSVDEAEALGAARVELSRPAVLYLEDFLGMPVGSAVPVGYYDRGEGQWKASEDGLVVQLVGVDGAGLALLDVDGDGAAEGAAALAALGVDEAERAELGRLYGAGQRLWRVELGHLTPWDCNWPYTVPEGMEEPPPEPRPLRALLGGEGDGPDGRGSGGGGDQGEGASRNCERRGSVILCEGQTLAQRFAVAGSGLTLRYQSNRAPGRRELYELEVPVDRVGANRGRSFLRREVSGWAAGRRLRRLDGGALVRRGDLLVARLGWDGRDGDGHPVYEPVSVTTRVCHVYRIYPRSRSRRGSSRVAVASFGRRFGGVEILVDRQRMELKLCRRWRGRKRLGVWDARAEGLLGLTLEAAGRLEARTMHVRWGDGRLERSGALRFRSEAGVERAGASTPTVPSEGASGAQVSLSRAELAGLLPDGAAVLLFSERAAGGETVWSAWILRRGRYVRWPGASGLRLPSNWAYEGLVQVAGERLYAIEVEGRGRSTVYRLVRLDARGRKEVLAGGRPARQCETLSYNGYDAAAYGDDGPAVGACIGRPLGLAVGPDGEVLLRDGFLLRRLGPEGRFERLLGGMPHSRPFVGEGERAAEGRILATGGPWVDPQGRIYLLSDSAGRGRLTELREDGTVHYLTPPTLGGTLDCGHHGCIEQVRGGEPLSERVAHRLRQMLFAPDGRRYLLSAGRLLLWTEGGRLLPVAGNTRGFGTLPERLWEGRRAEEVYLGPAGVRRLFADGAGTPWLLPRGARNKRLWTLRPGALRPRADGQWEGWLSDGRWARFDAAGRLLELRSGLEQGPLLRFGYDPSDGLLRSVADPFGNAVRIDRWSERHVVLTAPFGERTHLLDEDGDGWVDRIRYAADPAGRDIELRWGEGEAEGLLLELVDRTGLRHRYRYDASGRLTSAQRGALPAQQLALQPPEQREGTGPDGTTRRWVAWSVEHRDEAGRPTRYRVRRYASGRLEREVEGPDGLRTVARWERDGRLLLRAPDGTELRAVPGPDPVRGWTRPLLAEATVRAPSGAELLVRTEASGEAAPDGGALRYELRRTVAPGTAAEASWLLRWEAASRSWTLQSPAGRQATVWLDPQGRPERLRLPGRPELRLHYEARGRLAELRWRGADGTERRAELHYEPGLGPVAAAADPLGRLSKYRYDPLGRLRTLRDPSGAVHRFGYLEAERAVGLQPPGRGEHLLRFEEHGLLAEYAPPTLGAGPLGEAGRLRWRREPTGALAAFEDGVGGWQLRRDAAGRPVELRLPGRRLTLSYGADGRLQQAELPGPGGLQRLRWSWDGPRLLSVQSSGALSARLDFGYDAAWRLASERLDGEPEPLRFGYDPDGLLLRAGPLAIAREASSGRPTTVALGLATVALGYDAFGALASRAASWPGGGSFEAEADYDAAGQPTAWRERGSGGYLRRWRFEHDAAGRLTAVYEDGASEPAYRYEWDEAGRRIGLSQPGLSCPAPGCTEFDAQDRLLRQGAVRYEYDAAGRRTRRIGADGSVTEYHWSALGPLLQVLLPDGRRIGYELDPQGRTVARSVDGVVQWRLLYGPDGRPRARYDGAGNLLERYVYGGPHPIGPTAVLRADGARWLLVRDALGSVRRVVDADSGAVLREVDYDPFGRVLRDTAPSLLPFGYAGGLQDPDAALVRFGARVYDPESGTWLSKDPILFAGGSGYLYGYVLGDPVRYVDPSGRDALDVANWLDRHGVDDFAAGLGDAVSFGATELIRELWEIDASVDPCSGAYALGVASSLVVDPYSGGSGAALAALPRMRRLVLVDHAVLRVGQRGIGYEKIMEAILRGERYIDTKTGRFVYVLERGAGRSKLTVVVDSDTGYVVTTFKRRKIGDRFIK